MTEPGESMRLTEAEQEQVEAALDAEPQPVPELVALLEDVRGRNAQA